mgnify:CR=1 FL=1
MKRKKYQNILDKKIQNHNVRQIIDKKRILTILKKIRKESIKRNMDPKITHKIWKNMILAYIDFEKRNFKKK